MKPLVLNLPDDLPASVALTPGELESQVRLMAALKMFELGKLSSGKAAELAGLSKPAFLEACGLYRVSIFNYTDEEVARELEHDSQALRDPAAGSAA